MARSIRKSCFSEIGWKLRKSNQFCLCHSSLTNGETLFRTLVRHKNYHQRDSIWRMHVIRAVCVCKKFLVKFPNQTTSTGCSLGDKLAKYNIYNIYNIFHFLFSCWFPCYSSRAPPTAIFLFVTLSTKNHVESLQSTLYSLTHSIISFLFPVKWLRLLRDRIENLILYTTLLPWACKRASCWTLLKWTLELFYWNTTTVSHDTVQMQFTIDANNALVFRETLASSHCVNTG